jgi:hypothetical protein
MYQRIDYMKKRRIATNQLSFGCASYFCESAEGRKRC